MKKAWIDTKNKIISFHIIPHSTYFEAEKEKFWESIMILTNKKGFRIQ